jgi:hypothetical protein
LLVPFQSTNQFIHRGSALVQSCEGATPDVVPWLHEAGAVVMASELGSGHKCHQGIPSSTEFPYRKGQGQHTCENIQKQDVSTLSDKIFSKPRGAHPGWRVFRRSSLISHSSAPRPKSQPYKTASKLCRLCECALPERAGGHPRLRGRHASSPSGNFRLGDQWWRAPIHHATPGATRSARRSRFCRPHPSDSVDLGLLWSNHAIPN